MWRMLRLHDSWRKEQRFLNWAKGDKFLEAGTIDGYGPSWNLMWRWCNILTTSFKKAEPKKPEVSKTEEPKRKNLKTPETPKK